MYYLHFQTVPPEEIGKLFGIVAVLGDVSLLLGKIYKKYCTTNSIHEITRNFLARPFLLGTAEFDRQVLRLKKSINNVACIRESKI